MNGKVAKRLRREAKEGYSTEETEYKAIKRTFKTINPKTKSIEDIDKYQLLCDGWRKDYKNLKKEYRR